jgi:hypothetical protein
MKPKSELILESFRKRLETPEEEETRIRELQSQLSRPMPDYSSDMDTYRPLLAQLSRSSAQMGTLGGEAPKTTLPEYLKDVQAVSDSQNKMRSTEEAERRKQLLSAYEESQKRKDTREKMASDLGMKEYEAALGAERDTQRQGFEAGQLDKRMKQDESQFNRKLSLEKPIDSSKPYDGLANKAAESYVSKLSGELATKTMLNQSMRDQLENVRDAIKSKDTIRAKRSAEGILKLVNSQEGRDAIQAADRELIAAELSPNVLNIIDSGKPIDIEGWFNRVAKSVNKTSESNEKMRQHIKDVSGGSLFNYSQEPLGTFEEKTSTLRKQPKAARWTSDGMIEVED